MSTPLSHKAQFTPATMSEAPLIEALAVSVLLDKKLVLDHVDVLVRPQKILTVIGLNGSGKTTLARTLLGLVTPQSGRVIRQPGLRIGYVPQGLQRDSAMPLTAARFVGLAGHFSHADVTLTFETLAIKNLMDAQLAELSGGELRRVMLARALIRRPQLLVLDEPLSGVDVAGQAEFYRLISQIRDRDRCGVLLISHDLHLVMAQTDEVICLNHHVCCVGRPQAVLRDPNFVALFGKDVADALAVYRHAHDHVHGTHGEVIEHDHGHPHG